MPELPEQAYSVSDFVAYANQTLEYAYPLVTITGELSNFRVSKNRWVYFDLKDELASLRFFGTVYQLSGPLEDGMMLAVTGTPRLHPQFGFSITIQKIQLVGEGTIKRAASLLEDKLTQEGLFDPARKRTLPYPPSSLGLITSGESAAYADFMKIIKARWAGIQIYHSDVQVQGANAPGQIVKAISACNQLSEPPEALVIIRGGGSVDDLQAFSEESVVRSVAGSRIPTIVAIGHEKDVCLAELAADMRASTPSNAAELLTPDKTQVLASLEQYRRVMVHSLQTLTDRQLQQAVQCRTTLQDEFVSVLERAEQKLQMRRELLDAYNPHSALGRGYALIRSEKGVLRGLGGVEAGDTIEIEMHDAIARVSVEEIKRKEK